MKNLLYPYFLIVLIAIGCQTGNTAAQQDNIDSATQINQVKEEKVPNASIVNQFAQKVAQAGQFEIESSAQMIESTENPDVQTLAVIMLKEHGKMNSELDAVGKKMQLIIPKVLAKDKLAILQKMKPMEENEKNKFYASLMVKEHKEAIALFEKAVKEEKGELKAFAIKYLPAHRNHLREAEHVLHLQNVISGDKGDLPLKISKSNDDKSKVN